MQTEVKNEKVFQWIKGESEGKVVKVIDTFIDDNMEFLVFEDGSQCNSALIGEYIMPLEPGMVPPLPVVSNTTGIKMVKKLETQVKPIESATQITEAAHPVHELLRISKKTLVSMQITLDVEMPSDDLIRIVHESYENGSSIVGDYLVSAIDKNTLMSQIENMLKTKIEQISIKKKITKK